jgi:hypothetical protein
LSAFAVAEFSARSALQLIQWLAWSGDEALQSEQVCTACLLKKLIYAILP